MSAPYYLQAKDRGAKPQPTAVKEWSEVIHYALKLELHIAPYLPFFLPARDVQRVVVKNKKQKTKTEPKKQVLMTDPQHRPKYLQTVQVLTIKKTQDIGHPGQKKRSKPIQI